MACAPYPPPPLPNPTPNTGAELTQYKGLAGILASRFNGTPDDIGGPITDSLALAGMSTRERVEALEAQVG